MDPTATLDMIRTLIARHFSGDYVDTDRLIEAMDNLDTWLSKSGAIPAQWHRKVDIAMLHSRDYDGDCYTQLYVNGEQTTFSDYSVDPGRGHDFREYAESLAWDYIYAPEAMRPDLYEMALAALTDHYTMDAPDDDRVAARYLDWLIFDLPRRHPRNDTPPAPHTENCEGVAR